MTDIVPVKALSVARKQKGFPVAGVAGAAGLLGVLTFVWLAHARAATMVQDEGLPSLKPAAITQPQPLPVAPPPQGEATAPAALAPPPPQPPSAPVLRPSSQAVPANRSDDRLRSPALILDLALAMQDRAPAAAGPLRDTPVGGAVGLPVLPAAPPVPTASENERFSERVAKSSVDRVAAERTPGLDRLVVQGTVVAAVMETALNSDLPGFARAIVQRDVLSFDGSAVLIPAGSRVIGEYKSGVAQGASRIFIIWSRIIRPDGVSISLASPAIDDLGRGGVPGKVNRHFLQRFGGSILLSVLTGGISAATAALSRGSAVIVGSAGEASALAQQASQDLNIPPTITTRAGASVRIFVARDLDFGAVGPAQ